MQTEQIPVEAAPKEKIRQPRWRRALRWFIAILIAVAGLGYSSWVLEFILPINSNPTNTFLSQLAEKGAPFRWVFSTGDTVSGSLLVVAGLGGLLLFSRRLYSTIGWVALTCFGAATIADAQWPIVPEDPNRPKRYVDTGLFPQLHQIHALTSTLAVFSIYIAMIAFTVAAFKYRRWPILRHTGLWILIIGSAVTAWMLIADNLPGNYGLGIAQRIQVGAMSLWLVALAVQIVVAERDSGTPGRHRRTGTSSGH
ncbi:DUF998 domain-containing protein [Nocardia aurantiaca]|uniref:DUF998 domain-containing protein n=1 Tax=Nocardia aurantiaca TaxID=2675850 RepID=A0A6I3KSQ1_9NOCA|nr:DUF998 domain-containing protein [Nocardia aurantiaca]MTE12106.1 DUF998 domain-containing protein [Nocardia aurantiaca]